MHTCIVHPEKDFVIVFPGYLAIAENNECAAEILQRLEFWTNPLIGKIDRWIRRRIDDFQDALFRRWSRTSICNALKLLENLGLIKRRKNKESLVLQTREYWLEVEKVQGAVDEWYRQSLAAKTPAPKPSNPYEKGTFQNKTVHSPEMDDDPYLKIQANTTCVVTGSDESPEIPELAFNSSLRTELELASDAKGVTHGSRPKIPPVFSQGIFTFIEKISAYLSTKHYEIIQARVDKDGVIETAKVLKNVVATFEDQQSQIRRKAPWLTDALRAGYSPAGSEQERALSVSHPNPDQLEADERLTWHSEAIRTGLSVGCVEKAPGRWEIKLQSGGWRPWKDAALEYPLERLRSIAANHFVSMMPSQQHGFALMRQAMAEAEARANSGDKAKDGNLEAQDNQPPSPE